jgi:membrane fusion protein (multidrug efflux system)
MMNQRRRGLVIAGVVLLGGAATLVVTGIGSRKQALAALRTSTEDASIEDVSVIAPRKGDPIRNLDLPGDVNAWYAAPIYAQVSGYVKMWSKDYGAVVHGGDVLATINTPRLDAQFQTSKAQVDVADAKLALAELTAKRWKNLEGTQAVSKQQVDVQAANARTEEAEAAAARHDMAQYAALEGFRSIVAPFDGIVTARNINVGDYVSPGGGELSNKDDATELFSVADVHKLRIFVSVPQDYIDILKKGVTANITVPQFPGKVFHADFLTDASALDKDSRTVTTELVMDNPGNQIWPGSYAEVHFSVPSDTNTLLVPENALIFQEQGEQVAVVDASNHIVLKKVQVGRNLGQDVEILSGLSPDDRVVNNPSAGLLNGELARIEPATNGYNQVETATASEGQ